MRTSKGEHMNLMMIKITNGLQAGQNMMQYLFGQNDVEINEADCLGVGAMMPNDIASSVLFEMAPPTNLC
jgi:hypothetical protein